MMAVIRNKYSTIVGQIPPEHFKGVIVGGKKYLFSGLQWGGPWGEKLNL